MRFNQAFFKAVIPEVVFQGAEMPEAVHFAIDSRKVTSGDIFVAVKGDKVDGHDFIQEAIEQGATGLILSLDRQDALQRLSADIKKKIWIALVPRVVDNLIKLATHWRTQFTYPIIGITGSVGKTSTKEILSQILQINGNSFIASEGNQNTAFLVSLHILRMTSEHSMAIFEMGISKRGEMARMAEIVRPTTAIITGIGHSHMEGLGSLADIAHEKRDIFKYFKEDNIGIVNGDQQVLSHISYRHPIVKFGAKTTNQVQARKVQVDTNNTQFTLKLYKEQYKIVLNTNHAGRVMNVLAAASAAHLLGIAHESIIKGAQAPLAIKGRFRETEITAARGVLIDDCYNASPESMKAALLAFEKTESKGQKIAILGDMLGLGVNSPFWHRQLGRLLRKVPSLQHLVLVGEHVKWTQKTAPVHLPIELVANWQEAVDCIKKKLDKEAVILVKGSNSVGLDGLVKEFTQKSPTA